MLLRSAIVSAACLCAFTGCASTPSGQQPGHTGNPLYYVGNPRHCINDLTSFVDFEWLRKYRHLKVNNRRLAPVALGGAIAEVCNKVGPHTSDTDAANMVVGIIKKRYAIK